MISVPILILSPSMQVLIMVVSRLWAKVKRWLLSRTRGAKVETILLRGVRMMDVEVLNVRAHKRRSHLR